MSSNADSITSEGLVALKAELEELEGPARREIAARILRARELGDLKENAEYHQAKDDQAHLETKIQTLNERLRGAVVTEVSSDKQTVGFGSVVTWTDLGTEKSQTWTIVGAAEADAKERKLSLESPVARALDGHHPGDTVEVVTPKGSRKLRIDSID